MLIALEKKEERRGETGPSVVYKVRVGYIIGRIIKKFADVKLSQRQDSRKCRP